MRCFDGLLLVLVMTCLQYVSVAASICLSREDCCSLAGADHGGSPCCGSSLAGADAVQCGADGLCYRGTIQCRSSIDDPLCNIPGPSDGADVSAWRTCRRTSVKMRALRAGDTYGGRPIHEAAMLGRLESLELLVEEGVDVNERGYGGATPLHTAALLPQGSHSVQFLLAHGADPNAVDDFGFTPLHRFVDNNHVEGAVVLLYNGGNATVAAPGGETPLHLAAYENSRELAQLLLGFGADPFARNHRGVMSFEVGLFDMSVPPHHMN